MARKKVSSSHKVPEETRLSSESNEDESLDNSSSDSDSSDLDDGDGNKEMDTSPTQMKEDKCSVHKDKKFPEFKLTCLHSWGNEQLSACFKKHLEERRKRRAGSASAFGIAKPQTANFDPWWDEFTKSKHGKASTRWKITQKQDGDSYESWFSTTPKEGANWLCGPGPSSRPAANQKSKVEDIEVPSIYDKKPSTKGRRALKRERKAEREKTLGKKWFGMKAPDVDEKLKNDMELIQMRGVLDPKRFYKNHDRKGLPKYFQMGTVVDEGTDFYSSRLTKKQRKQTLVEELMADANIRQYNKKKYGELQQKMRSKKKFKAKKK